MIWFQYFGWFFVWGFGLQGWGYFLLEWDYDWMCFEIYQEVVCILEQVGFDFVIIEDVLLFGLFVMIDFCVWYVFGGFKYDLFLFVFLLFYVICYFGVVLIVNLVVYLFYIVV